jgi:hypothetical protein
MTRALALVAELVLWIGRCSDRDHGRSGNGHWLLKAQRLSATASKRGQSRADERRGEPSPARHQSAAVLSTDEPLRPDWVGWG